MSLGGAEDTQPVLCCVRGTEWPTRAVGTRWGPVTGAVGCAGERGLTGLQLESGPRPRGPGQRARAGQSGTPGPAALSWVLQVRVRTRGHDRAGHPWSSARAGGRGSAAWRARPSEDTGGALASSSWSCGRGHGHWEGRRRVPTVTSPPRLRPRTEALLSLLALPHLLLSRMRAMVTGEGELAVVLAAAAYQSAL